MGDFVFKNGEKVVFIGDSITDCGRRYEFAPFGNGYVKMVIDLITAKYPDRKITFYNKGIGGNTVEDLFNRWYDDVLALNPDWVSVKIGINDVHRSLSTNPPVLPPDKFRKFYSDILSQTKAKTKAKLILIEPFYISNDNSDSWRGRVLKILPHYIKVVHEMSKIYKTILVPIHSVFQNHLKYRPSDYFAPEPVHPYSNGHLIIAYEILKRLKW